jgi:hypothetical protein
VVELIAAMVRHVVFLVRIFHRFTKAAVVVVPSVDRATGGMSSIPWCGGSIWRVSVSHERGVRHTRWVGVQRRGPDFLFQSFFAIELKLE